MKLEELPIELKAATKAAEAQQAYVNQLVDLFNKGQTTIEVFDKNLNTWTEVPLSEFNAMQNGRLTELLKYQDTLQGLYDQLQSPLDEVFKTVPRPV